MSVEGCVSSCRVQSPTTRKLEILRPGQPKKQLFSLCLKRAHVPSERSFVILAFDIVSAISLYCSPLKKKFYTKNRVLPSGCVYLYCSHFSFDP